MPSLGSTWNAVNLSGPAPDPPDLFVSADHIAATGAGGATVREPVGDHDCPERWQCVPGHTMTEAPDDALTPAPTAPPARGTALPDEVVDVPAEPTEHPTDTVRTRPRQPEPRVTDDTGTTLPDGDDGVFRTTIPTAPPAPSSLMAATTGRPSTGPGATRPTPPTRTPRGPGSARSRLRRPARPADTARADGPPDSLRRAVGPFRPVSRAPSAGVRSPP